MNKEEQKWYRVYDLLHTETKTLSLCLPYTKQRKIFLQKKNHLRNKEVEVWTKNEKEAS